MVGSESIPSSVPSSDRTARATALVERYFQARLDTTVGDSALVSLIESARPIAERLAYQHGIPAADDDDVVQEALVQLARALPRLREPRAFPRWFAAIVRNACLQWRRRRQPGTVESLDRAPSPDDGPADVRDVAAARAFDAAESRDLVARYLAALPERERRVVAMFYLGDLSYAAIARDLGLSARAVEGVLYRGLRRLREVADQCRDEIAELEAWCSTCGEHRLRGYLRPGDGPDHPLWLQATCPGCQPAYFWWMNLSLGRTSYLSLDAAFADGWDRLGERVRHLARQPTPRCPLCRTPLRHQRLWGPVDRQGHFPYLSLRWECPKCASSIQAPALTIAEAAPTWRAFRDSARRLAVAKGLLFHAPVFILDEPTANVDPVGALQIREFLRNQLNRELGQTVVLTTHNLLEAEQLADRVAIIDRGRVAGCDRPAALLTDLRGQVLEMTVATDPEPLARDLRSRALATHVVDSRDERGIGHLRLLLEPDVDVPALRRFLAECGTPVLTIAETQPVLEDLFIRIAKGERRGGESGPALT